MSRSITINGKALSQTALLAAVIVYIYAAFGFTFFSDQYSVLESSSSSGCESMFECLLSHLNNGIREDAGISAILDPPSWDDSVSFLPCVYFEIHDSFQMMLDKIRK